MADVGRKKRLKISAELKLEVNWVSGESIRVKDHYGLRDAARRHEDSWKLYKIILKLLIITLSRVDIKSNDDQ